jgi:hypothetical protein
MMCRLFVIFILFLILPGCFPILEFNIKKADSIYLTLDIPVDKWQLDISEIEGSKWHLYIENVNYLNRLKLEKHTLRRDGFWALYPLEDGREIKMEILFPDSFYSYESSMLNPILPLPLPFAPFTHTNKKGNLRACLERAYSRVVLIFSAAEADFDNTRTFLILSDSNKVYGHDPGVRRKVDNIYSLADTTALQGRYPPEAYAGLPSAEEGQALFVLNFPLNCKDYKNSLLVLDGLSYKGAPLPPLRLRLNYSAEN